MNPTTQTYLLDTHVLIWWLVGDKRLKKATIATLEDKRNTILVSTASLHEYAIKEADGKMPLTAQALAKACEKLQIEIMPFGFNALQTYGKIHTTHKDPFDRAIVAQSLVANIPLITADHALLHLEIPNLQIIHA